MVALRRFDFSHLRLLLWTLAPLASEDPKSPPQLDQLWPHTGPFHNVCQSMLPSNCCPSHCQCVQPSRKCKLPLLCRKEYIFFFKELQKTLKLTLNWLDTDPQQLYSAQWWLYHSKDIQEIDKLPPRECQ